MIAPVLPTGCSFRYVKSTHKTAATISRGMRVHCEQSAADFKERLEAAGFDCSEAKESSLMPADGETKVETADEESHD